MGKKSENIFFPLLIVGLISTGLLVIGVFIYRVINVPALYAPYPYTFAGQEELRHMSIPTNNSQVLIIGDRMSKEFKKHQEDFVDKLSVNLKNPVKVINIGKAKFGIHRTLQQLKRIKKLPPVTIYFGATEEFAEEKYYFPEGNKILRNLEKFQDPEVKTLLKAFPFASKFLYYSIRPLNINKFDKAKFGHESETIRLSIEISVKMFELEFFELITYLKRRNSTLIVVTPPLNRHTPPRYVCKDSVSEEVEKIQLQSNDLMKEKKFRDAHELLVSTLADYPGNALSNFMLGTISTIVGNDDRARSFLNSAITSDCELWRGTPLHNDILTRMSDLYDIEIVPLDKIFTFRPEAFKDEIFLKDEYYQKLSTKLAKIVRQLLYL